MVIPLVTNKPEFQETWSIFALLMIGVWGASGYSPFYNLLVQAGYPGLYTLQMAALALINVAFNWLLIPKFGVNGSAIATSISWICSVPLLKWMVRRHVSMQI
jgi:O-antigen/teichoic acid export membrane protein